MTNNEPIHHLAIQIANIYIQSEQNANDKLKEDHHVSHNDVLKELSDLEKKIVHLQAELLAVETKKDQLKKYLKGVPPTTD